jgi:cyanophycin synthetase
MKQQPMGRSTQIDIAASPRANTALKPIQVIERSVYRGPHLFSHTPMIRVQLDLGALESYPTNTLPGFSAKLLALLPGLQNHGCGNRDAGGFERRLSDGTWLGHVCEHVALELQSLIGHPVTRGKTRSVAGRPGVYNMLYAYEQEDVGLQAGAYALRLVDSLLPADLRGVADLDILAPGHEGPFALDAALDDLRALARAGALGPTTRSLVDEAVRRGIPVLRLDHQSLIQLGQGSRQRRLRASITSQTSHLGVETASDKALTRTLLLDAGLPAPRGTCVRTEEEAVKAAQRLGFPVVTKPLDANHGRGVSIGLATDDAVRWGFEQARRHARRVIVETMLVGRDYRFLVVDGSVVAVAERRPAEVVGDGVSTIAELIAQTNADPRRGDGHEQVMTKITIDDHVVELLGREGLTLDAVPVAGRRVVLRSTANLSTGGSAVDRTEVAHPDNIAVAEQAAAVVGLDVAGIDLVTPDVSRSVRVAGGGIVEVNAAPGFRMHLQPSEGAPRNVARPVLRSLFPDAAASRIPIFAITGTNGKSTTVRMVASILQAAGQRVGLTTTSGVYIHNRLIVAADASGPKSARMVLRNPTVDVAVLEVARGGILREGLGYDMCDVGAVLNVTADHLGLKGIDTLKDLANVKSVVVESVRRRGHSILNADDPLTIRMARHAGGRIVWFSMRGGEDMPQFLRAHIEEGGLAVVCEPSGSGGEIILHREGERARICSVAEIPATLSGAAGFNVMNALAAAAMTCAHGLDLEIVRRGLQGFTSSFEQNPGRLNIYDNHPFRVIVDYAHNPAALGALAGLVERLRSEHHRVIGMVSIPGDRRDEDIREMGELAAGVFDSMVFREAPDGRGRPPGEVNSLLTEGALAGGAGLEQVQRIIDEGEATSRCLGMARPGDLVVLLPTSVEATWRRVLDFKPGGWRSQVGSLGVERHV